MTDNGHYTDRWFFEEKPNQPIMSNKPKINAMVIISQGEITSITMTEGTVESERKNITDSIVKLITLRNVVEAELINFEKKEQAKFLNKETANEERPV